MDIQCKVGDALDLQSDGGTAGAMLIKNNYKYLEKRIQISTLPKTIFYRPIAKYPDLTMKDIHMDYFDR